MRERGKTGEKGGLDLRMRIDGGCAYLEESI